MVEQLMSDDHVLAAEDVDEDAKTEAAGPVAEAEADDGLPEVAGGLPVPEGEGQSLQAEHIQ